MHKLLEFGVIAVLSAAYFEWWVYEEANFKRFVYSLWVLFVPDGLQSWGIHYFGTQAKSFVSSHGGGRKSSTVLAVLLHAS